MKTKEWLDAWTVFVSGLVTSFHYPDPTSALKIASGADNLMVEWEKRAAGLRVNGACIICGDNDCEHFDGVLLRQDIPLPPLKNI